MRGEGGERKKQFEERRARRKEKQQNQALNPQTTCAATARIGLLSYTRLMRPKSRMKETILSRDGKISTIGAKPEKSIVIS